MTHLPTAAIVLALAALATAATPATNPAEPELEAFAQFDDPNDLLARQDFDPDKAPLDATVADYLKQHRPAIDLLMQAAKLKQAFWNESTDIQRHLDDGKHARHAARLMWLAARYDAANGQPARAVDEMLAGIAVGRHFGQRNLLICHLVEIGCEAGSITRLAAMLPALPKEVVETLPGKLDALPPSSGLAGAIDGERAFALKVLPQQLKAGVPPKVALPANATPKERAEAEAKQAEQARMVAAGNAVATAQMNAAGPFYDAVKKAAHQSPEEFDKSVKAAAAAMPGNAMVQVLAPSLGRARVSSATIETQQAMLRTAIAITLYGEGELAKHKDPFGTGPFQREAAEGGYVLTGTVKSGRGKPVMLRVGK